MDPPTSTPTPPPPTTASSTLQPDVEVEAISSYSSSIPASSRPASLRSRTSIRKTRDEKAYESYLNDPYVHDHLNDPNFTYRQSVDDFAQNTDHIQWYGDPDKARSADVYPGQQEQQYEFEQEQYECAAPLGPFSNPCLISHSVISAIGMRTTRHIQKSEPPSPTPMTPLCRPIPLGCGSWASSSPYSSLP